ncbi:H-NS histone family protein [Luteimonas fraxinea]|uniref:H-NS histone family protein n=1 Tax=Luteimonas fraxinea TaxID=2901869 RepID=A0ABS8UEV4_9GAMM|nr:H-NS histone family protein [Luteimonas fraxinea]MCD9098031.1 H-NS histone family protein [Luteimonas fraxinea]UHH09244.1 H-NS histone family protein [Luteimonas fraxinea]
MAVLLTDLTADQLTSLIDQATERRKLLKKRKPIAVVRRKLEAAAAESGYSVAELFGAGARPASSPPKKSGSQAGAKVAAKYRNPAAPDQTWSGRGLKPIWLRDAMAQCGAKLEDFLI